MHIRCPSCLLATTVKKENSRGLTCSCGFDLEHYYFSQRDDKQAEAFIYSENIRLKSLKNQQDRAQAHELRQTVEELANENATLKQYINETSDTDLIRETNDYPEEKKNEVVGDDQWLLGNLPTIFYIFWSLTHMSLWFDPNWIYVDPDPNDNTLSDIIMPFIMPKFLSLMSFFAGNLIIAGSIGVLVSFFIFGNSLVKRSPKSTVSVLFLFMSLYLCLVSFPATCCNYGFYYWLSGISFTFWIYVYYLSPIIISAVLLDIIVILIGPRKKEERTN